MKSKFEGDWFHIVNDRITYSFMGDEFIFHCEGVWFHESNPTIRGKFTFDEEEISFIEIKDGTEGAAWKNTYKLEDEKMILNFVSFEKDIPVRIVGSYIKSWG